MFLDIAIGIFVSIWFSGIYHIPLSFHLLLGASAIALVPDLDFLVDEVYFQLFKKRLKRHDHRDIFHYPIFYLPLGALFLVLFAGSVWAFIFLVISSLHFLHDSIGIGWGVYWLYPFSSNRYSFFYHYDIFRHKLKPYKWVYSWNQAELNRIIPAYGDPDWFKNIYVKFHPYAVFELLVFLAALYALFRAHFF